MCNVRVKTIVDVVVYETPIGTIDRFLNTNPEESAAF